MSQLTHLDILKRTGRVLLVVGLLDNALVIPPNLSSMQSRGLMN